ncbi:MAG: DUF6691 family protein [Weeksellaceae bacterium]
MKKSTPHIKTNSIESKEQSTSILSYLRYLLLGIWFGVIIIKAEVVSWFRIQEMFRFESFHMYGVIGSAILVGMISILVIKKLKIKSLDGKPIHIQPKEFRKGQIFGGFIFGLGWAMTGACPGPMFANFGHGYTVFLVAIVSAILGTFVYGRFKDYLPN